MVFNNKKKKKKKERKPFKYSPTAVLYFTQTFKTFIVTIVTNTGKVLGWVNSGMCGFKGKHKLSYSAIEVIAKIIAKKLKKLKKTKFIFVLYIRINAFVESLIKYLLDYKFILVFIKFKPRNSHNGLRGKKIRRL